MQLPCVNKLPHHVMLPNWQLKHHVSLSSTHLHLLMCDAEKSTTLYEPAARRCHSNMMPFYARFVRSIRERWPPWRSTFITVHATGKIQATMDARDIHTKKATSYTGELINYGCNKTFHTFTCNCPSQPHL